MPYKDHFIQFTIDNKVLKFGEFTLKSGRLSPYFFNTGLFNTGATIAKLGKFYAQTIAASGIKFDVLFGPAYKGIPLACVVAVYLVEDYDINVGFAFDRKVAKDHGEGGVIVGAELTGRVLVIDDVITAGTSIRHSIDLIHQHNADFVGVIISLDRQEQSSTGLSAIQAIKQNYDVPVISIANLTDLINFVAQNPEYKDNLAQIITYRQQYGVD